MLSKTLTELLGYRVRRLFTDRPNPTFKPHPWTKIINWGNSNDTTGVGASVPHVVNPHLAVALASNKLGTFRALENKDDIRIPVFTADHGVAMGWLRDGISVVVRHQLSGHSGAGIELVNPPQDTLPAAPLYVQYIKKQSEFRVHVAFGEVIDVQQKRKRRDLEEGFVANFQVRNHHTGWVYCREDIHEPTGLREMATAAVLACGLDFGAVDIIHNAKRGENYVLEINTAPGLEGTTVTKYAEAFVKALK